MAALKAVHEKQHLAKPTEEESGEGGAYIGGIGAFPKRKAGSSRIKAAYTVGRNRETRDRAGRRFAKYLRRAYAPPIAPFRPTPPRNS